MYASDNVVSGAVWTVEFAQDGTAKLVCNGQVLVYDAASNSFVLYLVENAPATAVYPTLYAKGGYPQLSWTPSIEENISSLKEFTFTCEMGLNYNEETGVPAIKYYSWDPMTGETVTVEFELTVTRPNDDNNTLVLSLEEEITEEGMYHLSIPEGYFVLDPNGLCVASEAIGVYYNVVDNSPLTIVSTNPAEGAVESLKHIEVVFSHDINEVYKAINVLDGNGEVVCTATPSFQDANGEWYADYNIVAFVLETEITEAGTYVLDIPADYISKVQGNAYFEGAKLTYTIGNGNTGDDDDDTKVKYYRIKDINSGKYLHIGEYNANNATGPIGSVIVSEYAESGDQMFAIEEDENGKYLVSYNGYYIVCRAWNVDACNDGQKSAIDLVSTGNEGEYYITNANGYFKVENVGGIDYPFCDAPATAAAVWVLEEVTDFTGIENVATEGTVEAIYDLTGRKVETITTKGIYIINGKKVLVK